MNTFLPGEPTLDQLIFFTIVLPKFIFGEDLCTGQLTPDRVYDTDSDGYNELVVASSNGWLMVYDTDAETPFPAPRTWVLFYSEYRLGAAEYVPPPGIR